MNYKDKITRAISMKNSEDTQNKIKTMTYTATVDNTISIPHNLPYVSTTVELQIYYMYIGGLLVLGDQYIENTATSITLLDWSISIGERLKFVLIKNVK